MKCKQHPLLSLSPLLPLPFSPSVQLGGVGPSAKAPNSLDETWSISVSPAIRKRAHVSGSSSQPGAVGAPLSDVNNSSGAGSGTVWGQVDPTRHLPPPSTNLSHLPLIPLSHIHLRILNIHHHSTSLSSFLFHRNPRSIELNWLNSICASFLLTSFCAR